MTKELEKIVSMAKEEMNFYKMKEELEVPKYELLRDFYKIIHHKTEMRLPWDVEYYLRKEYLKNISFTNLEEKAIFISDTHLGSREENIFYLEQLKDFLKKAKIKTLFHGGDIGDGMVKYDLKYNNYALQVEHILEVFRSFPEMKMFFLAGNHDEKYKKHGDDILALLEEMNPNMIGLGYYQAYFKVFQHPISFEHHSQKKDALMQEEFIISGHSHEADFLPGKVKLPTISDSMPNRRTNKSTPGFLVLTPKKIKNNVNLTFERYVFSNQKVLKKEQKEYVLKKIVH